MKNTLYRIISFSASILLALFTLSCSKSNDEVETFVEIEDGAYTVNYDKAGGMRQFTMFSNIGHWQILPQYEEDWEWVTVFPKEGTNDARFKVLIKENDSAYPRCCVLNIVNDKGEVISAITFNQDGSNPKMEVLYTKSSKICSALGEQFKIKVSANIDWDVSIPDDCTWLTKGEHTDTYQTFIVEPNPTDQERETDIIFFVDGTAISQSLKIVQAKHSESFESAVQISIKDLREAVVTTGTVNENVYIKANVISDYTSKNFDGKQIFLMDESGAGIMILMDDEDSNDYPVNSLLTVHVFGMHASIDSTTKALCFADVTRASIMKSEESEGIAPIEIDDITQLENYESCLVKVKDVEYVLPLGTYCNIVESSIGEDYGDYAIAASLPFSEYNYEYVHLLRDRNGNKGQLLTLGYSNFRAARLIPEGTGDITGVVMSREKAEGRVYNLRMRSLEDDTVSDDPSTRRSQTVMQIGPWDAYKLGLDKAVARIGTGQLLQSATGESIAPSSTIGSVSMYFAPIYCRNHVATLVDGKWLPAYANTTDVQYYGIVAQDWWDNNFNRIPDCLGTAWMVKTSTLGYNGQLSFEIMQASSSSGPLYYTLEWGTDENATLDQWHEITTYPVCNTSVSSSLKIFSIDLPEECNNRSDLILRLRVPNDRRAKNSNTPIDKGGTSRLSEIRISCR